jgi:lipopolysaccharide export system permease protein
MIGFTRLDRLLGFRVLAAIALAWLSLVGFDVFLTFARESRAAGTGDYTLGTAFLYVLATAPRRAHELFPTAAVIGAVAGLGAFAPTAELTAMRAGGWSKLRIAGGALVWIALLTAAVVLMGETVSSWSERQAQALRAGAQSRDLVATGRSGVWAREGDTLINARRGEALPDRLVLHEVRLFEFDAEGRLTALVTAAQAVHDGGGWHLDEVVRQAFDAAGVTTTREPRLDWGAALDPRLLSMSLVQPKYMNIRDLRAAIAYYERNGIEHAEHDSALWARVFYPINVLVLTLIAMPFAFGNLRTGGLGKRLMIGILVAVGWFFAQRAIIDIAEVYGTPFWLAQLVPVLVLGGVAGWYYRRHG